MIVYLLLNLISSIIVIVLYELTVIEFATMITADIAIEFQSYDT